MSQAGGCPEVGQGWHVSGESSVQRVGRGDVHTQLYRLHCYRSGLYKSRGDKVERGS